VRVIGLYPGTFDPFHNGHLDISRRALQMFDEVVIAVYDLPNKKLLFPHAQRVALVQECLAEFVQAGRLRVTGYSGLTVDFARRIGAKHMVRGLRNSVDFEYELQMSQTNNWLAPDIESVFLFANAPHSFLSATLVREITQLGGDVTQLVPPCVASALHAIKPKLAES
jgi:pantetheine-phosphate adenylyltransferase